MNSVYKLLYSLFFRILVCSSASRLSILIYHRVLKEKDEMRPWEPTAQEFCDQMEWISEFFTPLPLAEALSKLEKGCLPDRAIVVTFDDGYADNESVALPILRKFDIPATVFVASSFLDGGRMWNDTVIECFRVFSNNTLDLRSFGLSEYRLHSMNMRVESACQLLDDMKYYSPERRQEVVAFLVDLCPDLPNDLMMTIDQLKSLRANGVEIGAHTCTHPILTSTINEQAYLEIINSKAKLERALSEPIRYFAYPNGKPGIDYAIEHRDMVQKAGFEAALSTHVGVTNTESDLWQLPRYTPWNRTKLKFLVRLALNSRNIFSGLSATEKTVA